MSGRSPAGPLMQEHRVIERMIAVLERELGIMTREHRVDSALIDQATDFIRTYADRCHHGKEEDILFRRLAEKELDPELASAMADLVADHVRGRALTRELIAANEWHRGGDGSALSIIVRATAELVDFYPVHIEKEDRHFFKPALEYFTDEERAQMLVDFEEFEVRLLHEKYEGMVAALEAGQE